MAPSLKDQSRSMASSSFCRCSRLMLAVSGLLTLTIGVRFASADDPVAPSSLASLLKSTVQTSSPSVVAVALVRSPSGQFGFSQDLSLDLLLSGNQTAFLPLRVGCGVILQMSDDRKSTLILTCAHLLEPLIQAEASVSELQPVVCLNDGVTISASLRALDGRSDLAVLEISLPTTAEEPSSLVPAQIGDGARLAAGDLVVTFGDPRGISQRDGPAAGMGLVSRRESSRLRGRSVGQTDPLASLGEWLRVDGAVGRNTSGGGVFNLQGELVGLITALPAVAHPRFEMSYVLPCSAGAKRIINKLKNGEEVDYGFLGVQFESEVSEQLPSRKAPLLRFEPGKEFAGVGVVQVTGNSPASRAGLHPRDRILKLDQAEVHHSFDAQRRLALQGAGATVSMTVYRPETRQELELSATLMKWPASEGVSSYAVVQKPAWRGLQIDDATYRRPFTSDGFIPEVPAGVLIRSVEPGSPAELAGLKIDGFIVKVGEELVETPEEFRNALQYWPHTVPVTLADGREVMIEDAR